MPKQYKKSKKSDSSSCSKSDSFSSSSKSSKDSRSKSSKSDCKDDKCRADCREKVSVETDVCPEVCVEKNAKSTANYKVGVCIDAKPNCSIRHVSSKQITPCKVECVLEVDLCVEYDAKARAFDGRSFPKTTLGLEAKNKFKTRCSKA